MYKDSLEMQNLEFSNLENIKKFVANSSGMYREINQQFSSRRQEKLGIKNIHGQQRVVNISANKKNIDTGTYGMNEKQFVDDALSSPHPFQVPHLADPNILLTSFISILKPELVKEVREYRDKVLKDIKEIIEPYEEIVARARPKHLARLAPGHKPIYMSVLGRIFNWPDQDLAYDTWAGFEITGKIKAQHVFKRKNFEKELNKEMSDLLKDPMKWTIRQERRIRNQEKDKIKDPDFDFQQDGGDPTLMKKTLIEMDRCESSGFYDAEELDQIFGKDKWKPMLRFVTWSAGKWREIDSGLAAGHNAATVVEERIDVDSIHTPDDFVHYMKLFWDLTPEEIRAKYLEPVGGTEDLKRAYRQCGVKASQLRYSISLLPWLSKPKYIVVYGLVFGLTSARIPI